MPIGRFARLTGLTVKALRHYDEVGLLRPASVDPESGYRLYAPDQMRRAEAIQRLRRLELPLDDVLTCSTRTSRRCSIASCTPTSTGRPCARSS